MQGSGYQLPQHLTSNLSTYGFLMSVSMRVNPQVQYESIINIYMTLSFTRCVRLMLLEVRIAWQKMLFFCCSHLYILIGKLIIGGISRR